jgi:hypothetical protein
MSALISAEMAAVLPEHRALEYGKPGTSERSLQRMVKAGR